MHQRDLRRIARGVEHALAEKGAAEADAVKPADQFAVLIDLDGVAVAALVELAVEIADAAIDPGPRAARRGPGAAVDDRVEIAIDRDGKTIGAHGARQPVRHVEAVERDDAAPFRLDPIERRVVGALGHRKNAAGIGLEQHFRRDVDECGLAARHEHLV